MRAKDMRERVTMPRTPDYRCVACAGAALLLLLCGTQPLYANAPLSVSPTWLDTGLSNISSALYITTTSSNNVLWAAAVAQPGSSAWLRLSSATGVVNSAYPNAVPLIIHRDVLPAPGGYTALVVVAGPESIHTVTVATVITPSINGMFPRIRSTPNGYAGMPYQFDCLGSVGWIKDFFWVTNYNPSIPLADQAISTEPRDDETFPIPDELTLTLHARDVHGNSQVDSAPVRIWNSPPSVNAGGPYSVAIGATVTVVAAGHDPNPNEELVYAWQFAPPNGPFTPASHAPTASVVWSSPFDGYVVCVVSDTWTGAAGTYNGPLGALAVAQVFVTNQPPQIETAFALGDGGWSAWAPTHDVNALRLPATNVQVRAQAHDADAYPAPVELEWRASPMNPLADVLPLTSTSAILHLPPLSVPGAYHFNAVAYDGACQSAPAEVRVTTPGVVCTIIADGFQSVLPVWGVYSSATHPGNTNAFGEHDETEATRSAIDGRMMLDRPADAACFVELERTANGENSHTQLTFYTSTTAHGGVRQRSLRFPTQRYPYSARIINGAAATVTLVLYPDVTVASVCNDAGLFSFGELVKALPLDGPTSALHCVVQKAGHVSLCIEKPLPTITGSLKPDVYDLPLTTNTITLRGRIYAAQSGLPIAGARVSFGATTVTADADGLFAMAPMAPAYQPNPSFPSHVLLCSAPNYPTARRILYNTATGGFVHIAMDEPLRQMYGTIFDSDTTNILRDATVTALATGATTAYACAVSPLGYYALPLPLECDAVVVQARGLSEQFTVMPHAMATMQRNFVFTGTPEPAGAGLIALGLLARRLSAKSGKPS